MSTEIAVSAKPLSRIRSVFLPLLRHRKMQSILRDADLSTLSPVELAQTLGARSPTAVAHLWKKLTKEADRLCNKGVIDETRHLELADFLRKSDPLAISEAISPYHALLSELEFYQISDAMTRLTFRRSIGKFARHHRLPPESAALLWKGETAPPSRLSALFLLLPLPLSVAIVLMLASALPPMGVTILLFALPTLFFAGYLLTAATLRKLLPTAPLPLLQSGTGHSMLTIGIGEAEQFTAALEGIARIACAGHGDCRYLLLLTLPSHVVCEAAGEEEQIAHWQRQVEALAERLDVPLSLLVAPRRFDARKKRWNGKPNFTELTALVSRYLTDSNISCEAVCILPADAAILPGSGERLTAALFHPLCKADALVFLSPAHSPLPKARLSTLRQCLLQKFDAPADLVGWGIYRTEGLIRLGEGHSLSPRLVSQPLFSGNGGEQAPYAAPVRQTPSLLPVLDWLLPLLRLTLLFGMIAAKLSLSHCLLLWLAASADLMASALLSLRISRRFFLYTLPAWKRLGKTFLLRTLLPTSGLWTALGGKNLTGLSLVTLLFGSGVIATGAPLAFMGLCWCIAPLLLADVPLRSRLNADEKAACHALATELYPLLQENQESLPPAYLTESGERAPYTTPVTIGTRLAAELAACDLGLIDAYTLERRVDAIISRIEKLPTRGGLPYARYAPDTGDYYQDSHIDTAACGIYALCLAAVEAGLWEYAPRQPGLYPLAKRIAHLSMQMDFTLLLRSDHTLCSTLTTDGEQNGTLSHLFSDGIPLFAALSSDSTIGMGGAEKSAAWQKLLSPAILQKGHCPIASRRGLLEDYLLTTLLLPAPAESLLTYGTAQALHTVMREAKRRERRTFSKQLATLSRSLQEILKRVRLFPIRKSLATSAETSLPPAPTAKMNSLRGWRPLSRRPSPITSGSHLLCKSTNYTPQEITAPLLCMMIGENPRLALAHLQRLQESAPMGGFADPERPGQIPLGGASLGLMALAGAVTGKQFSARLMALPRCGALYPFLCRRPDAAVEGESLLTASTAEKADGFTPPSVMLLGDAAHGLLIAKGSGISLWEGRIPLTAPVSAGGLFANGRMSGLLLFREGKLLPLPVAVSRREAGQLTLSGGGMTCRIGRQPWGWNLCWERADAHPDQARFLFCPVATGSLRLSQETVTAADGAKLLCLCVEYSPTHTLVIAAEGLADAFTHADAAPFPRGIDQIPSILHLTPKPANGWLQSPSCIIGGALSGTFLTVRIVFAVSKATALALVQEPSASLEEARTDLPLPLPTPDGSLAAKVLEWQIASLFAGAPIPAAMATGGEGSDSAHLDRCLAGGKELLTGKGFPAADHAPLPLTVSRRAGAEALMNRLLADAPEEGETPLLPATGQIRYPDGFPKITRGRDLPTITRMYHNQIATLYADPEAIRLRLSATTEELSLQLFLSQNGRTWLLPAASTHVTYSPSEALFSGDEFTLRMALLPKHPLLVIRLVANGSAKLTLPSLPSPHKTEGEDRLWHTAEEKVLFCRQLAGDGETIWLIGCFPKANDHFYYWVRETITPDSLSAILERQAQTLRRTVSLLQIEGEDAPPLPAIASAVMGSNSPACALLAPLIEPANTTAHLVQLAMGEPTLLLPMALLIRVAVTDDCKICNLRLPIKGGRASLYLIAARYLERAMEEDAANPLLPPLVEAFAQLAQRMGDLSGLAHYSAFGQESESATAPSWNALPHVSPETIEVLAALQWGKAGAVSAAWEAIRNLPIRPNPLDAALLWCGVLWGVLGFIPHRDGFTLAPQAVEEETHIRLSYKGQWQIRLSPHAPPICSRGEESRSEHPLTEEKIFRNPNISRQNSCILKRNGVK